MSCLTCGGLIVEPNKHYSYSGPICCCGSNQKLKPWTDLPSGGHKLALDTLLEQATKHDSGKRRLTLVTREALEGIARAMEYGAKKYDVNNYKKGMAWSRLLDSAMRHLVAFANGESNDPESGLSHLDHLGANVNMLMYYEAKSVGEDDRYKDGE